MRFGLAPLLSKRLEAGALQILSAHHDVGRAGALLAAVDGGLAAMEGAVEALLDSEDFEAGDLRAGAALFDLAESRRGELRRQSAEGDDPAGSTGLLERERVFGGHAEVPAGELENLGAGYTPRQEGPPLGDVRCDVFEDVDELESLAEGRGAFAQGRRDRRERLSPEQEEVCQHLADDPGDRVAVGAK